MKQELIVDNFAGGGGASLGIEKAAWRSPDIAINHDAEAIAMHEANHPHTKHYCESVWDVDPKEVTNGRPVGLAWFSPDCKHFSKAKGGKPVEKKIRGLAWVVIRWARQVKPRIIALENVEEFQDWGPLLPNGRPCPARKSLLFRRWVSILEGSGYNVEWRELRACDYGAPTIRKRLFVIARCDGKPINWPAPTHGPGLRPYATAAQCIDWSVPVHSIFLTKEQVKELGLRIKRPLAENTMKRIARGVFKYVINSADPFIVRVAHGDSGGRRIFDIDEPLMTLSASQEFGVVSPHLTHVQHSSAKSGAMPADESMRTVTAHPKGGGIALTAAFLAQHNGGPNNNGLTGRNAGEPLSTVTTRGTQQNIVSAHLMPHFGVSVGRSMHEPAPTVMPCGQGKSALVTSHLAHMRGSNVGGGGDLRAPMKALTAGGNHIAEVRAFLLKYYGTAIGQPVDDPLHSTTAKARFGLVTVGGTDYQIADIGMRMLIARELYRAQGFPDSYVIDPIINGRPLSITAQVRMCGNSVCPDVAQAILEANFVNQAVRGAA